VSPNEALDLLGLDPSAKPTQIKEAYKDLVNVWHPDRFGNNARLRQKAETKLAELNEAYRTLQNPSAPRQSQPQPAAPQSRSHPKRSQSSRNFAIPRRLYPQIAVAIVFLIGYLVLRYLAARPSAPTELPASPAPAVMQQPAEPPKPDSAHPQPTHHELQTVESICASIKNSQGNSAYVHCLEQHLDHAKPSTHIPSQSATTR
jgi:hypothetical protein